MDDNRIFILPNGEYFKLEDNFNFIFETSDISQASPATISRLFIFRQSLKKAEIKNQVTSDQEFFKHCRQNRQSMILFVDNSLDFLEQLAKEVIFYINTETTVLNLIEFLF